MPKRKKEQEEENLERWLLTYADLITLLLAFFIVMYSMSKVDAKKFGAMVTALQGVLKGGSSVLKGEAMIVGNESLGAGPLKLGELRMIQAKIKQIAEEEKILTQIDTKIDERGLTIHVLESALFDEAKADLKPTVLRTLDLITEELLKISNHIRIEGHTDNTPIRTTKFPSNWELSTARATQVLRYMVEKHSFPPKKISALGYGEYRPLAPNISVENKALNRRVDIIVLSAKSCEDEPVPPSDSLLTKIEE